MIDYVFKTYEKDNNENKKDILNNFSEVFNLKSKVKYIFKIIYSDIKNKKEISKKK